MLKYVNHDIVFQEFPDEVTLAVNLSRCPCACPGCHSTYLWGDNGEELTEERWLALVEQYGRTITCAALMGGDNDPAAVGELFALVRRVYGDKLKTGWYSGRAQLPKDFDPRLFDYVKLGPYIEERGPLKAATTNQRLYRFVDGQQTDITACFHKH